MYKTRTANGTTNDVSKFAKIFTVKERPFGNVDWYSKQIIFSVFQISPYQGLKKETYMLSIFNTDSVGESKIDLIKLSNPNIKKYSRELKCVYTKTNNIIDVYVNSISDGVPVHVNVEYISNDGMFEFIYNDSFKSINNIVEEQSLFRNEIIINAQNSWTIDNKHSCEYVNGEVKIDISFNSGQLASNTSSISIARIEEAYRPSKTIIRSCVYKSVADSTYKMAPCLLTEYGEILVYVCEKAERVSINFNYSL